MTANEDYWVEVPSIKNVRFLPHYKRGNQELPC